MSVVSALVGEEFDALKRTTRVAPGRAGTLRSWLRYRCLGMPPLRRRVSSLPVDGGAALQVMLAAARAARDPRARQELRRLLVADLDWKHLTQTAARHRMLVIVARAVLDHAADCVSEDTRATLRRVCRSSTAESMRKLGQLLTVLEVLEEAGIRSLPLKGPVLAQMAYGDLGLRMSSDLDVLLSGTDLRAAVGKLQTRGYRLQLQLGERQMAELVRFGCELWLAPAGGGAPLELHWAIVPRNIGCGLDMDRVGQRAVTVNVLGRAVLWPQADDLFLILCLHGSKHRWGQLELMHSVAELAAKGRDVDWTGLVETATTLGCRRRCLLGGLLAAEVLGAPIPEEFLRQARADRRVVCLSKEARECLSATGREEASVLEAMRWNIATLDTTRRRLAYVLMLTLVPSLGDWERLSLPPRLYPLYYVTRPFRLFAKYVCRWTGLPR